MAAVSRWQTPPQATVASPALGHPNPSGPPCALRPVRAPPQVIAPDQVRKGFMAAIEAMDDLRLDVPDVVDQLALFICRWAAPLPDPSLPTLTLPRPRARPACPPSRGCAAAQGRCSVARAAGGAVQVPPSGAAPGTLRWLCCLPAFACKGSAHAQPPSPLQSRGGRRAAAVVCGPHLRPRRQPCSGAEAQVRAAPGGQALGGAAAALLGVGRGVQV